MHYKGYKGVGLFDQEANCFHGEVIDINDVITFKATSIEELEQAFKDSIDAYLVWCKERNELPEKSFSCI